MIRFLWICLGGALGTGARYLVVLGAARAFGSTFPAGTLLVNVVGSFLLGLVMHLGSATQLLSPTARLALTTGVIGGFTTYSTFSYETADFLRRGAAQYAVVNVIVTVAGCLIAVFGGVAVARLIVGR